MKVKVGQSSKIKKDSNLIIKISSIKFKLDFQYFKTNKILMYFYIVNLGFIIKCIPNTAVKILHNLLKHIYIVCVFLTKIYVYFI